MPPGIHGALSSGEVAIVHTLENTEFICGGILRLIITTLILQKHLIVGASIDIYSDSDFSFLNINYMYGCLPLTSSNASKLTRCFG